MRIRDSRDWQSCLNSIRRRLNYVDFKAAAGEVEEGTLDRVMGIAVEIDQEIAEGMLHTVVSLPEPEDVSSQLEQFAAELEMIRPDPAGVAETGFVGQAYRDLFDVFTPVQRGLPAVVETFKVYAEGGYDLRDETADVLKEALNRLDDEPQVALRLAGEAGSLYLRGLGEVDALLLDEGAQPPEEPLADWVNAIGDVVGGIADNLEEYPLGEVELARDQWRAPDDEERIEYRRGKLARLGIVEPEIQTLLLPLLAPQEHNLSEAEREAIIAAGPKVVPRLIAIAGDDDSQMETSISGGEAPITAVRLLGQMRAAEAVPTLLEILENTDPLAIIHDQTLQVLQDEMPDLAFDMAVEVFDRATNIDLKSDMAGVLAKGGRGKPGVFERLIEYFRKEKREQDIIAVYLAHLGDPRALPDLHEAFRRADNWTKVVELEEAIVNLGGELSAAEKQKSQRVSAPTFPGPGLARRPQPAPVAQPGPVRVTKIGRNEPCPCGSGKKYKKCCGR